MPSLAESTSISLKNLGYTPVAPTANSSSYAGEPNVSPIFRGTTASVANSPIVNNANFKSLPRTKVAAVPPLSDAAFPDAIAAATTSNVIVSGSGSGAGSGSSTSSSVQAKTSVPSSTSSTGLASTNTALTTPSLNQNGYFSAALQIGLTFVLYQLAVSAPARVQIYGSAAAQTADAGRPITIPPSPGTANALIADFDLERSTESNWICSPTVVGANTESPRSPSIYVTVTNTAATSTPITVTLFYLPLET